MHRKRLLMIGTLALAIAALVMGLEWSTVARVPPGEHLVFGDSLLMSFLVYLRFGSIPEGWDVFIHPVALAGWVGLFVTALNLFPVGQLDGGRIARAITWKITGDRNRATRFAALLGRGWLTRFPPSRFPAHSTDLRSWRECVTSVAKGPSPGTT